MNPHARLGRVADVALERLQANGFALTTLEDIARDAKLGEGDLQALFGDLEGLMSELVSPLVSHLQEIATSAGAGDLRLAERLRVVVGAYFDALVDHRRLVGVAVGDPSAGSSESLRAVRAAMSAVRDDLASGTGGDLEHAIRAASALGAVQSAVLELADVEPGTVRNVVTEAAVAILLS